MACATAQPGQQQVHHHVCSAAGAEAHVKPAAAKYSVSAGGEKTSDTILLFSG